MLDGGAGDDPIYGEAGNDVINGGEGNDTVYGSPGNDMIDIGRGLGRADGGAGNDRVSIDWSDMAWDIQWLAALNGGLSYDSLASGSGFDRISADLASSEAFGLYNWNTGRTIYYQNAEQVSLTGGNGNDLLVGFGAGGHYRGGGGTDTFYYADWSSAPDAIVWTNDPTQPQTQTVHGVQASGLERLLLATGSGNDLLRNLAVGTADYLSTGAGNDLLDGGSGADEMRGGTGMMSTTSMRPATR